jgi:hypothetical protein
MRKFYFLFVLFISSFTLHAQVNSYEFSENVGSYTPITGGTVVAKATGTSGTAGLDSENYPVTLPFPFTFNGTQYTTVNVNTNGYITFGTTLPTASTTTPISSTTAYAGAASALGANLRGVFATTGTRTTGSTDITNVANLNGISVGDVLSGTGIPTGTTVAAISGNTITMSAAATSTSSTAFSVGTGEIRTAITGTSPNRTFVIQYSNFQLSASSNSALNFQIRLNEGGGIAGAQTIEFVYGPILQASSTTVQVGLRGASNSDYNNRTTTTDWTASSPGGANTATMTLVTSGATPVFPPEGLTYTFTPVTCLAPGGITTTVTNNTATVTYTPPAGDPVLQYEYELRTSGAVGSGATGLVQSGSTTGTTVNFTGLTPNTNYFFYIRTACTTGSFSGYIGPIRIANRANDECLGAIPLTVNNDLGCASSYTDSTSVATQTLAGCSGTADDDVWFRFTASNASHRIKLFNKSAIAPGTSTSLVFQVFSGSCATPTSLICSTTDSANVFGLTPGTEYFIRVYNSGTTFTKFDICVGTPGPSPANDDCAAAVSLTPSATTVCGTPTHGTTINASPSNEAAPTCSATGTNDDVWYSFVASGPTHIVTLTNTTSTTAVAVYRGACGALTQVGCASTTTTVTGLTAGQTYFVRVYTTSSGLALGSEFDICVTSPVANDECAGAFSLTASSTTTCTPTAGTTDNASPSANTAPTCSATGINDDVWYSFVATSTTQNVYIDNESSETAAAVYSGACGSLTQVACASAGVTIATGLTVGNTYYVRVYTTSSSATTSSTFDICVTAAPSNDECTAPIALPAPSATSTCGSPLAGNTIGATQSGTAAPSCSGTGTNDDVWYTFVASAPRQTVLISDASTTTAAALYSGTCSGTLTMISCGTGGAAATNLVPGNTYYVRVYSTSTTVTTYSEFNICVITSTAANDDCAGAVALPAPSATQVCTTPTAGTTQGATPSTENAPSCSATGTNDDVWYSFVATAASHTVVLTDETSTTAAAVYSGTCGALTQVANACGSGGTTITGLTPGTTYYVRVYSTSTTVGTYSNFNICLVSPPANDECTGAQALTVSSTTSCTPTTGTTVGATPSAGAPAPSCSPTGVNDDVWYSFVATSPIHTVDLSDETSTTAAAVYSGSCGTLTQIANACGSGGTAVTGLTPGNTYYVRVYTTATGTGTFSDFGICVVSAPANDNCGNAQSLTVSNTATCTSPTSGTTTGATPSTETAPSCSATGVNDDVWYSFVATSATHTVSLTNTSNTTAAAVYSGACGSLVQLTDACGSNNTVATGLTPGTTYYVRVYTTTSTPGTFSDFNICIAVLPQNDDCANAITVAIPPSGCNTVSGTTVGATPSTETAPTCSATGVNDDVWYSFVATGTSHVVSVSNTSSTMAAAVYSGACGNLTQVACASTTVTATGLTPGSTYYVRLYTTTSTTTTYSGFNLCIGSPVANDDCTSPVTLTQQSGSGTPTTTPVNTQLATQTTFATTTCFSNSFDDDLWYTFTATNSTLIMRVSNYTSVSGTAGGFSYGIYSGTCATPTEVSCNAGSAGNGDVTVTGLTPGNQYLLRLMTNGTAGRASFNIALVSPVILPVHLVAFSGENRGNSNLLRWTTASEQNARGYYIERSADAVNFTTVGYVASQSVGGNSSSQLHYTYTDNTVARPKYYYRLRQEDLDGRTKMSGVVIVKSTKAAAITVSGIFPNPASSNINVMIDAPVKDNVTIIITDVSGRILKTQKAVINSGTNTFDVGIGEMASGMYMLKVICESNCETKVSKFIKQ